MQQKTEINPSPLWSSGSAPYPYLNANATGAPVRATELPMLPGLDNQLSILIKNHPSLSELIWKKRVNSPAWT